MRLGGAALAATMMLGLVACGDDDRAPRSDERNEADETYVQVAAAGSTRSLAELAEDRGASEPLLDLAAEIAEEAGDAADRLKRLEDDWDLEPLVYDSVARLPAQEPDPDRQRLNDLDGEEFDTLWVELMVEHLESLSSSSETVIDRGRHPELRRLAEDLLADCERWRDELAALEV